MVPEKKKKKKVLGDIKDFRRSVGEKFFYGELVKISNLILIGFILLILLYFNY